MFSKARCDKRLSVVMASLPATIRAF